jgi:hypothetical protein
MYNHEKRHSALDILAPVQYRTACSVDFGKRYLGMDISKLATRNFFASTKKIITFVPS